MKAVVVGSGFGGLAASLILSKKGFEVTVLEKQDRPGGRSRELTIGEYRFDMGPSWYLMKDAFNTFFNDASISPPEVVKLEKLYSLATGKYGEKGEVYDVFSDLSPFSDQIHSYLSTLEEMYGIAMNKFIFKEMRLRDFLDADVIRNFSRLPLFSNLNEFNRRFFHSDWELKALGFPAVFLGGSPFNIPAIYSIINYSILSEGVFYPKGGFSGLVNYLYQKCVERKVSFHFNVNVDKIETRDKRITSVISGEKRFEGDVFVFNADYRFIDSLLPSQYSLGSLYWSKRKLAPSALLFYLGVDDLEFPHHQVIVNGNWKEHFDSIERGTAPAIENTSYYVSYRAATDKEIRAKDLVLLIPIAPGVNVESPELILKGILRDLKQKTSQEITVKEAKIYTPMDFSRDYNAYNGTAFGIAHTLDQTGPFRPPNSHRKLKNAFFVGQYAQPGIGVPMVLTSAVITSREIMRRYG
ncbi:phytoene dehydrogenase [Sulfolobales archaeon HS-7]|nr:phytoene dehydrogenase [Sulfolobales archaeon HS-7]